MTRFRFLVQTPKGETEITSIVMDGEEFAALRAFAGSLRLQCSNIPAESSIISMGRGTKTEPLFAHYEVDTQLVSFVLRGTARAAGMVPATPELN